MADQQLRIYHVGIRLVEFRVLKIQPDMARPKLGRSSLETIASVQDYLQKHQAVLGEEDVKVAAPLVLPVDSRKPPRNSK